jgi:hypothetical protein
MTCLKVEQIHVMIIVRASTHVRQHAHPARLTANALTSTDRYTHANVRAF